MDQNSSNTDQAGETTGTDAGRKAGASDQAPAAASTLEERLVAAEARASEHYDAFLRARAEGENIRRRSQDEISKAHKFAVESFAAELIAVKDSLEAALVSTETGAEAMRAGVKLTLRQLKAAFEKGGVREIDPAGERFDPNRHQAISAIPSEQEPNTVVGVLQKGYLIAERTLRPALVTVARKPD